MVTTEPRPKPTPPLCLSCYQPVKTWSEWWDGDCPKEPIFGHLIDPKGIDNLINDAEEDADAT